ncbi:hypothetical protein K443DRAFT_628196, partial [Laccaria amethystina LaAM-08-1]
VCRFYICSTHPNVARGWPDSLASPDFGSIFFFVSFCTRVNGSVICIYYLQEKCFYGKVYLLCRSK